MYLVVLPPIISFHEGSFFFEILFRNLTSVNDLLLLLFFLDLIGGAIRSKIRWPRFFHGSRSIILAHGPVCDALELGADLLGPRLVLKLIIDLLTSSVNDSRKCDTTSDSFALDVVQVVSGDNESLANLHLGSSYSFVIVFWWFGKIKLRTKAVHRSDMLFAVPNEGRMNISFLQL